MTEYEQYAKRNQREGRQTRQRIERARREEVFVQWVNELGRALRRVRAGVSSSDEELKRRLKAIDDVPEELAAGFSDRVTVGQLKQFVDACDGTIEIILRDAKGEVVSRTQGGRLEIESELITTIADRVVAAVGSRLGLHRQAEEEAPPVRFRAEDDEAAPSLHESAGPLYRHEDGDKGR